MKVSIGAYKKNTTVRSISIKIDKFDTWSMDHTLAMIIVPMLQQLKATKHGAPFTEDEDVPVAIRSTSAASKEKEWDTDEFHFERWNYILDEMLWAMQQIAGDGKEEDKFFDFSDQGMEINKKMKTDHAGLNLYHERIKNGCTLFGKYFTALWD